MAQTLPKLDQLITKVRSLPEARQRAIADALEEMTTEPYVLSDEETALLTPLLAEAKSSIGLSDAETDDLLNKPWA